LHPGVAVGLMCFRYCRRDPGIAGVAVLAIVGFSARWLWLGPLVSPTDRSLFVNWLPSAGCLWGNVAYLIRLATGAM